MAYTKNSLLILALLCFILIKEMEMYGGLVGAEHIECGGKCNYRCSKASRYKRCMRACNSCCERCNCVPPGTSGSRDLCPCYATLTTHGGKLKCP